MDSTAAFKTTILVSFDENSYEFLLIVVFFVSFLTLSRPFPSGPRSRQTSVEVDHPMNHEEVYKNLRKTTAEIQNYSFESKLDRDANSKDSGISQMGENHMMHAPSNGFNNGHHIG
jgi:hypothetical protein